MQKRLAEKKLNQAFVVRLQPGIKSLQMFDLVTKMQHRQAFKFYEDADYVNAYFM